MVGQSESDARERGLGFAGLSRFMSTDKEHAGFVFRRFGALAARDLLYRQSELLELQAQLERLDKEDVASGDIRRRAAKDWQKLAEEGLDSSGVQRADGATDASRVTTPLHANAAAAERKALVLGIRHALKEYRKLIMPAGRSH